MTILGIDPGIAATGYGIIKLCNGQAKMEGYGTVGSNAVTSFPRRLNRIYEGISGVIKTYRPDHIAIEDVFYSKNIRSTLSIGQARGVAILASVRAGIDISEYAPREVKRAVVGSGAASKEQVQFMVRKLLDVEDSSVTGDAADALAVALCHANRVSMDEIKKVT